MKRAAHRLLFILLAVFLTVPGSAYAIDLTVKPSGVLVQTCYTPADAEAEQAVRIRTVLMVIGLNCQASQYRGTPENLYAIYREFVGDHGPQLAAYEKQMIDYFARAGSTDPESNLNEMSTAFGNQFALTVAQIRPDIFCYQYSKRLLKARALSADQFRQWVLEAEAGHPPSRPMCPADAPANTAPVTAH
jgi:hypothetical protein